jgi:hypothetical protein
MPNEVVAYVRPFGSIELATLRIGGVSFTHQPDDMRLMLLTALEQLDIAVSAASSGTETTPDACGRCGRTDWRTAADECMWDECPARAERPA